jgi:hypothetical protein
MRQITAEQSPQTRGSSTTRAQFGHQRLAASCGRGGIGLSSDISFLKRSREAVREATWACEVEPYTDRVTYHRQQTWKALFAIAAVIGLLLLALYPSQSVSALPACVVLLPIMFFGLVNVPRSLWPVAEASLEIQHQCLERLSLFQRPPPFA